jgi:hypothetical protein
MVHHWGGLQPKPSKYFGFIYLIREKSTDRFYIGKRQYWMSNRSVKSTTLRPNKTEGVWNDKHWMPSKWETYTSSSIELNELIKKNPEDFVYLIMGQYTCKADLVYAEVKFQMDYNVMTERDEEGNRLSYNKQVAPVRFIPPCLPKEGGVAWISTP